MINEEWKEAGREAFQEKKWNRFKRKLKKHLETEGHSEDEITNAIEKLKNELGTELPEKVDDVNPFKAQDKMIGGIFSDKSTGGFRNLKYETLFTSLDLEKVSVKAGIDSDSELSVAKNEINEFKDAEHPEQNKQIIIRNLELLDGLLDKREMMLDQVSKLPERKLRVDLGWVEEIGNLPIGRWETRQRIYNYWEGIHKDKYNAVKRRFKTFIEKSQPFIKGDSIDKDMKEAFEEVKELYRGQFTEDGSIVPNYVLKLQPFKMLIEDDFSAAVSLIGLFLELSGIEQNVYSSKRERGKGEGSDDESVGEDSDYEYDEFAEKPKYKEEATLSEEEEKIIDVWDKEFTSKLKGKRTKAVEVDPIFWSKYNDNYEDISIPLSDLRKIRGHLTGEGENATVPLTSIMGKFKEGNRLENFTNWFEKWAKNMQLGRGEGPYFLPISEFIENEYYKDINAANVEVVEFGEKDKTKNFGEFELATRAKSKKGGTVLWSEFNPFKGSGGEEAKKELTPDTLAKTNEYTQRFLETIVKLGKEINDAFDVYNQKATELGETDSKQVYGNLGAIKQISSQGVDRKIPTELTDSWNSLMMALHEYYIEPISGKMFVKAEEKPRWATSNEWLNLSKMVKDKEGNLVSPIGSLLDKGMSDISIEDIENLITFMKIATRGTILVDDNTLLEKGKDASEALDNVFGRQFSERNKISILNVVFESNPNSTLSGAKNDIKRYYSDLNDKADKSKMSLKEYVKDEYSKSKNFPIDMLRHAINLPEFTAFYGISDYRAGAPKKQPDIFGEEGGAPRAEKQRLDAMDPEMHKALLELDKLFDSFHKMDEINQSLLYAHDTIRKMENKTIVKSYLSLTDVDQMGMVIDKIHKENRMYLTATEIDRIVKAVSSYESISRNYGINEEVVYKVKGMFR